MQTGTGVLKPSSLFLLTTRQTVDVEQGPRFWWRSSEQLSAEHTVLQCRTRVEKKPCFFCVGVSRLQTVLINKLFVWADCLQFGSYSQAIEQTNEGLTPKTSAINQILGRKTYHINPVLLIKTHLVLQCVYYNYFQSFNSL